MTQKAPGAEASGAFLIWVVPKKTLTNITLTGHTFAMKITISIPDTLFQDAEKLAQRLHFTRSQLYSRALVEFVARHGEEEITSKMNQVIDQLDSGRDELKSEEEFRREGAKQLFRRSEW